MSQFKIGDTVRFVDSQENRDDFLSLIGKTTTILDVDRGFVKIDLMGGGWKASRLTKVCSVRSSQMTKAEYVEFVRKTFDDMHALIQRKNKDYSGKGDDPFANFRKASAVGVDPLAGVVVRLLDKISRIESFFQNGNLQNEALEDAFLDTVGYSCIALGMLKERKS